MVAILEIILLLLIGAIAGGFGGLLGLGGAIIMVPALTLGLGVPIHLAIAVSLISNIFVSLTAVIGYWRRGLLHARTVLVMNLGSLAGIGIGTIVALQSPADLIKVIFGLFLLVLIGEAVVRKPRLDSERMAEPARINVPAFSLLGFFMGLLGALLGLGGGTIAVPVQNSLLMVPLKNAVANSLGTIVVSATAGALLYFAIGAGSAFPADEALWTAAAVVPGSVIGARVATGVSEQLQTRQVKFIFYAVLLIIACGMVKSGMGW